MRLLPENPRLSLSVGDQCVQMAGGAAHRGRLSAAPGGQLRQKMPALLAWRAEKKDHGHVGSDLCRIGDGNGAMFMVSPSTSPVSWQSETATVSPSTNMTPSTPRPSHPWGMSGSIKALSGKRSDSLSSVWTRLNKWPRCLAVVTSHPGWMILRER